MAFSSLRNRRRRPFVHRTIKGLVALSRAEIPRYAHTNRRETAEIILSRIGRCACSSQPHLLSKFVVAVAMTYSRSAAVTGSNFKVLRTCFQGTKPDSALLGLLVQSKAFEIPRGRKPETAAQKPSVSRSRRNSAPNRLSSVLSAQLCFALLCSADSYVRGLAKAHSGQPFLPLTSRSLDALTLDLASVNVTPNLLILRKSRWLIT
jgi:hypothetical protein